MNTSNNKPSSSRPQGGAGFRSGPIRNVGGGPPALGSGLAINRPTIITSAAANTNNKKSSSSTPTRPTAASTAPPVPSAPRQQSYDPFSQQRITNTSSNVAPSTPTRAAGGTTFTPDNSAQLQPHVVSLPPSPGPPPPQTQQQSSSAVVAPPAFEHPLQPSSLPPQNKTAAQQQPGLYQAKSSLDPTNPAAELQRRFYPKHYNNQQQQQMSTTSSHQVKSTPTVITTTSPPRQKAVSTTMYSQQQQQQTQQSQAQQQPPPPIQRNKPPSSSTAQPTPDEVDLDIFLSTGISDSASGMTYTRPKPLPLSTTTGVLSKSKLLATRRAWGDVIRVTNDALIVRNMDGNIMGGGSDVGKHHSFYSEIVACASGNGSSGASGAGAASSPNEMDEIQKLRRETCELIVLRFIAHLKLRRYVDLGKEVHMLGLLPFLPDKSGGVDGDDDDEYGSGNNNNDDDEEDDDSVNHYHHPLSWKEGSIHPTEPKDTLPTWIPYGLRILAAQQLQYNDGSSKALDVLLDMRDRTVRTEYWNTRGMEVWTSTIDNAIVDACIRMKEWRLALHFLEELIGGVEEGVNREVLWWCRHQDNGVVAGNSLIGEDETREQLRELITSAAYVELLSRQILVLLQSGAIKAADSVQDDVHLHASRVEGIVLTGALSCIHREFALVRQVPIRLRVNDGLINFAQADYELAAKRFREAIELQESITADSNNDPSALNSIDVPSSPSYPSWKDLDSPTLGFDADSSLTVECINNLSLCLLYSGKMREAVREMESLIRKDPCEYLTEGMAFNLCTLYELGSDGEECTRRKKRLQRVAKRFFLHDIGVESFRLN